LHAYAIGHSKHFTRLLTFGALRLKNMQLVPPTVANTVPRGGAAVENMVAANTLEVQQVAHIAAGDRRDGGGIQFGGGEVSNRIGLCHVVGIISTHEDTGGAEHF